MIILLKIMFALDIFITICILPTIYIFMNNNFVSLHSKPEEKEYTKSIAPKLEPFSFYNFCS